MRFPSFFLLPLLILIPSGAVSAQSPLDDVETLLGLGRILQAREVLQDWMDREESSSGRLDRQRGIWLRAILTVDPSMAELDLRRLVLEFPGGPHSDDALLRLAQLSDLRGELRQAATRYSTLERDYPSSPLRRVATEWLLDHREEVEALGPEPSPRRETTTPPILQVEGPDAPRQTGGPFSVQLGAFRNLAGARSLASALQGRGYEPRLVRLPGNDLIRVRVGRLGDRGEASNLKEELERAGFEAAVVSNAHTEEEVG